MPKWRILIAAGCGFAIAVAGGCSGNPFGSGNPFNSGPSKFDVTFISAAETWDLDKDAVVTCAEWQQYALSAHTEADGDGDGSLTQPEYVNMARSDRLFDVATLKYYDRNSDGRVSREELTGHKNRAFELLDKNSDCKIERNEKVQVRYKAKKKDTDYSGEAAKNPTGGGPGPGGYLQPGSD